ncbi:hypothetical protein FRB94_006960 [Tulasnella sp. JGI-2019a]|nr:hypothetical protein FRB94_006960 [Tulasnella sp. JGI-2019a]
MALPPAALRICFCLLAFVPLLVVTISSPIWNQISFLDANIVGQDIHFGVFGYTGSAKLLGYPIDQLSTSSPIINSKAVHNLTYVLVLHPISALLALVASAFGLFKYRVAMAICASLTMFVTLVIFVIDWVLFGILRNHLQNQGYPATYGGAYYLIFGALVALSGALWASRSDLFEVYNHHRNEKV